MKQLIILVILIFCLSFKQNHDNLSEKKLSPKKPKQETGLKKDCSVLVELFIDSLNIGIKGSYKIELKKFRTSVGSVLKINFFKRNNEKWEMNQSFDYIKDGVLNCDVKLSDFNNDGFNDITYVSSIRARGANEIRRLFIFEKLKGKLVLMKNSEQFQNMLYNKELDCIDAFLVYGGSSTVFLKIEADSLRQFAGVDIGWGDLESYLVSKEGKRKTIIKDNKFEASYVRYLNYKTLKMYENF